MYGRFTDQARKVMQLANQEAERLNHEYIGTEYLLLGLVRVGPSVAANVLKNLGVDSGDVGLEVEKIVPSGQETMSGKQPQPPRVKMAIEHAMEEARNLNHDYLGTGHVLLGLLHEQVGVAGHVLTTLGLRLEDVRRKVLNFPGHSNGDEGTDLQDRP